MIRLAYLVHDYYNNQHIENTMYSYIYEQVYTMQFIL